MWKPDEGFLADYGLAFVDGIFFVFLVYLDSVLLGLTLEFCFLHSGIVFGVWGQFEFYISTCAAVSVLI